MQESSSEGRPSDNFFEDFSVNSDKTHPKTNLDTWITAQCQANYLSIHTQECKDF